MADAEQPHNVPWTIQQACDFWQVKSKQTYYNWKKRGYANFPKEFKLGGGVRLWSADVMEFTIESARVEGDSRSPEPEVLAEPGRVEPAPMYPQDSPATLDPVPVEEVPIVRVAGSTRVPIPPVTEYAVAAVRELLVGNAAVGCPVCMDDVLGALHMPQGDAASVGYAERVLERITHSSFEEQGILLGLLVYPQRPDVSPLASQARQAKLLGRDVSTVEAYTAELLKVVQLYEVHAFSGGTWQWRPQVFGRNVGIPKLTRVPSW